MARKIKVSAVKQVHFKCNTPALLNEVVNNALRPNMGVLKVPMRIFQNYLGQVAQRCAEINDPVLTYLMCQMALFEESDPFSKDYSSEMVSASEENYNEYLKSVKK